MFRTDLAFLNQMFQNNDISKFNLIIVNQTTEDKILISNQPNVKVINSKERGSPSSRNTAIQNALSDICLMSDDDICYEPNLYEKINYAYDQFPYADMISFEAIDENGQPYTNYPPSGRHNKKSLKKIYTWVISFRREKFSKKNILFNHYFGVGSTFKGETEYVFLRNAYDKGLEMIHEKSIIVSHPNDNSGKRMGSNEGVEARSALHYRFVGFLSYVWLIKYLFFLIRHNYIDYSEVCYKFSIGIKAIKTYKNLEKDGLINKTYESKVY